MLPILSLILNSNSSVSQLEAQAGINTLRSAIVSAFTRPSGANGCATMLEWPGNLTTFNTTTAATTPEIPLNLTLYGGSVKITSPATVPAPTPQPIANFPVAYEYVTFRNAAYVMNDPDIPGNQLWIGTVAMKLDEMTNSSGTGKIIMNPERTLGSVLFSVSPPTAVPPNSISSCTVIDDLKSMCAELGGVPNPSPSPPTCIINFPCPPNTVFAGNDANGSPVCNTIPLTTCQAGQGMTIGPGGTTICKTP